MEPPGPDNLHVIFLCGQNPSFDACAFGLPVILDLLLTDSPELTQWSKLSLVSKAFAETIRARHSYRHLFFENWSDMYSYPYEVGWFNLPSSWTAASLLTYFARRRIRVSQSRHHRDSEYPFGFIDMYRQWQPVCLLRRLCALHHQARRWESNPVLPR